MKGRKNTPFDFTSGAAEIIEPASKAVTIKDAKWTIVTTKEMKTSPAQRCKKRRKEHCSSLSASEGGRLRSCDSYRGG
jgi:hypothetical protein